MNPSARRQQAGTGGVQRASLSFCRASLTHARAPTVCPVPAMLPLPSPEHVQLLSPSRLDAACRADDSDAPTDDERALARLARLEQARRLGLITSRERTTNRRPASPA